MSLLNYIGISHLRLQEVPFVDVTFSAAPFLRPVRRRGDWVSWLNDGEDEEELSQIRQSISRGRPYGDEAWVAATARRLGLMSSLRAVGRPRKRAREGDA